MAESGNTWRSVDTLSAAGISPGDFERLREAGLATVESIVHSANRHLIKIRGFSEAISEAKVAKIKEEAGRIVPTGFTSATVLHQRRNNVVKVRQLFAKLELESPT